MANSYVSCHMHLIFSTKRREKMIAPEMRPRLWAYLGGIARENSMKAVAVGGVDDHVHLLLSLPSTVSVAKAAQLIKGGSSLWVHQTFPQLRDFAWQEGYGAFAVSVSQIDRTVAYINNQEVHHGRKTFQEEYLEFLRKHGVAYDERYLWD